MSSERKLKKPSASIVARLMGFEGLPYQQPVSMQCHELWDDVTPYRHNFLKKRFKEDDVCKDVFIVHETVKAEQVRRRSVESSGSVRNFDGQRAVNGQHQAIDWKFNSRVKLGDSPFMLDSNKEVFVKFSQNPTPLLTKHLNGLQSSGMKARCFHMTARNAMRDPFSELKDRRRNSSRQQETSCCTTRSTSTGRRDILEHSTSWSGKEVRHFRDILEHSTDSEYEMPSFPARIVVLEPNHKRSNKQHTSESVRPPLTYDASDSDYATESSNVQQCGKKIYGHQVKFSSGMEKKSEEPQRNSRKKIHRLRNAALGFTPKISAGYVGDESSFYSSEDELMDVLASQNSVDSSRRSSLSNSAGAFLPVKYKNNLSEHFVTTGIWQKTSSKRITLGKRRSDPDNEDRAGTLNSRIDDHGTDTYGLEAPGDCKCPLGIDNMKARYLQDSSMNKSVKGPSAALRVSKSSMQPKILKDASRVRTNETSGLCSNASHVDISENETFTVRNDKLHRSSRSSRSSNGESGDHSTKVLVSQNQQKPIVSNTCKVDADSFTVDHISEYEYLIPAEPRAPLEKLQNKDMKTYHSDMLITQEIFIQQTEDSVAPITSPVLGSISPVSSTEAEQPSPVSVLEFPDLYASSSGSECFGRVSADLQGLREQVRMLKLELGQEDDQPELPQTNDVTGKDTVPSYEEKGLLLDQVSDSPYLADVLVECGFDFEVADPNAFLLAWDVLPMELSVFEKLEKKYGKKAAWPRSERRLLFDHINSGLVEILNQYTNPCVWGKSITKKLAPVSKNALKDDLCKLLIGQKEKEDDGNFEVQELAVVDGLDLRENIHEIGREVEETLLDELLAEYFKEGF